MNQAKPEERSEPDLDAGLDAAPSAETARAESSQGPTDSLEAEIAELKDRLLRAVAETDNVRKRAERDREQAAKFAIVPFARDLVPVADNLERALKAVPADQVDNAAIRILTEGVGMVERDLLAIFERHGIKRIVPRGEPFNPNFHQAVAEMASPGAAPGTVLEVIQAGYVLEERLIRPAMVVVAKAGDATARPGGTVDTSA